jgi:signal peptidase II
MGLFVMTVLLLSMTLTFLDQATKRLVTERFYLGESLPVLPGFFNLTYVRNTGAAWGLFGGFSAGLALVSAVVLVALVVYRRAFLTDSLAHRLALGLMIAGIVGNLLDRVRLGYVVDFLDFHRGGSHFPAFNVADSCICVGVGIYLLTSIGATLRKTPAGEAGA